MNLSNLRLLRSHIYCLMSLDACCTLSFVALKPPVTSLVKRAGAYYIYIYVGRHLQDRLWKSIYQTFLNMPSLTLPDVDIFIGVLTQKNKRVFLFPITTSGDSYVFKEHKIPVFLVLIGIRIEFNLPKLTRAWFPAHCSRQRKVEIIKVSFLGPDSYTAVKSSPKLQNWRTFSGLSCHLPERFQCKYPVWCQVHLWQDKAMGNCGNCSRTPPWGQFDRQS